MRVLISIARFVGILALSALAACGKKESTTTTVSETVVAQAPAPAATPAPAPSTVAPAAASGPAAIATADGEKPGVRAEVTELKRTSGGTLSLKLVMINDSTESLSFGYDFVDRAHDVTDFGGIGGVHLLDPVGKKKYFVARDTESKCVCSQGVADIKPGSRANLWAKFPAPPDDVEKISIVIPRFGPMDDVPISR